MIVTLKSVNCVFDTETKFTYPIMENGHFDNTSPVHLYRCTKDWVDSLSDEDIVLINEPPISQMEDLESYGRGRSKY